MGQWWCWEACVNGAMRTSGIMKSTVVVLGGKYQEGDERPVIETEMDSGGVGRKVSRA